MSIFVYIIYVFLCSISFFYGFISYIVQCFLVWSRGARIRLLGDVEIQLIGCLGGFDGCIVVGCVWVHGHLCVTHV